MESSKALARAKHAASRRGRLRFSQHKRQAQQIRTDPLEQELWKDYENALPTELDDDLLEEQLNAKSKGMDYGELLLQDPLSSYVNISAGVWDEDGIENIGFHDLSLGDEITSGTDTAALDLDLLSESLSSMVLGQRLFTDADDDRLPAELKVNRKEDDSAESEGEREERDEVVDSGSGREYEISEVKEIEDAEFDLDRILSMVEVGVGGNEEGDEGSVDKEELDAWLDSII